MVMKRFSAFRSFTANVAYVIFGVNVLEMSLKSFSGTEVMGAVFAHELAILVVSYHVRAHSTFREEVLAADLAGDVLDGFVGCHVVAQDLSGGTGKSAFFAFEGTETAVGVQVLF